MNTTLSVLNAAAVGIFGTIFSAALCDIRWERSKTRTLLQGMFLLALIQIVIFLLLGTDMVEKLYPLIMHLPLFLLLTHLSGQRLWSLLAVLIAYLCCQLRRWIALLVTAAFSNSDLMQIVVELIITLPLLLLLLRYVAPAVRELSGYKRSIQLQFGLVPAICYLFDYLTTVYTDWLMLDYPVAKEFMFFVCAGSYLVFVMRSTSDLRRQSELEQAQAVLDLQVKQATRQLQEIQKSQQLAAVYRHDLHHHLQCLLSYLDNGELQQARDYINSLHQDLTSQTVRRYCENTTINLLLSVYAERANKANIPWDVQVRVADVSLPVADSDLCVLLSNATENALNACTDCLAAGEPAHVQISGYEKNGKLSFQITNSYTGHITFQDDLPSTTQPGHGMGVRSICAIVEKYHGLCSFSASDGLFTLRCSI